ncbi:hypothetical protein K1T71_003482 [Dendrolimus kikuchii]|uniref:Uncharacterized protein n=1 Tax=Dendrolimus kikuchii TaxID=765133 RepID=A0ACC1DC01_9NEOP|nr:hypothetical protein K1T71_003482 [Dendrolimus kikuchii]
MFLYGILEAGLQRRGLNKKLYCLTKVQETPHPCVSAAQSIKRVGRFIRAYSLRKVKCAGSSHCSSRVDRVAPAHQRRTCDHLCNQDAKMLKQILFAVMACTIVIGIETNDNKFIKDYAMLKIYESCFGSSLLNQITKELKDAYAKCSPSAPPIKEPLNSIPPGLLSRLPAGFAIDPDTHTITKPLDGVITSAENEGPIKDQNQSPPKLPIGGLLSFRPQGATFPQPAVNPFVSPQFRPFSQATPFYPLQYNAPGLFVPPGLPYNPYAFQPQYQQGFYQQPYFGNSRMSRHLGIRNRLGMRSSGGHNVTCVMQELGYIDSNLEPNYEQIRHRISNLPVTNELKNDIQDGLQFCQKFSQCIPEDKRDIIPRPHEQIKAIFFFRCYKHKKLEACIMKDINEHFNKDYVFDTDTDFGTLTRSARSVRSAGDLPLRDPSLQALEEMEVYLYDFLSGGGGFDFDLYI